MAATYLSTRVGSDILRDGFERIREEFEVPQGFSRQAVATARRAAARDLDGLADNTGLDFVTIDPEGAMDLDQAVFITRRGDGYTVHYAIADVPGFLPAGSPLDAEVRARGVTVYSPDHKVPLHPVVLSEDAASLLEGQVRPALVWSMDLDASGALESARVRRAVVRSRSRLSYAQAQRAIDAESDESLLLLREVGLLLQGQERRRGGVSLPGMEQEIIADGGAFDLVMRQPLPVEGWNAQISLLTGRAAAAMMLDAGVGILRTMPAPSAKDVDRVRGVARSLGIPWADGESYPEVIGRMDPGQAAQAAFLDACPALLRGAGYTPFDGQAPELSTHSAVAAPYAHVTAPLRRLVDRWGLQVCLAASGGESVPQWVCEGLFEVAEHMKAGSRRASAVERANLDLVEAYVMHDRVGDEFDAVVLEARDDWSQIQLQDPAVISRCRDRLPVGRRVRVRLVSADVQQRKVWFEGIRSEAVTG
jgi:exoribonuclease R